MTGRFLFQGAVASLTLPHGLFFSDLAVVYMQVSGSVPKEVRLDSGGEVVEIKDGAALHLFPRRSPRLVFGKRLIFAVIDEGGRHLCEWATNIETAKRDAPFVREGFEPATPTRQTGLFKMQSFYNAGDPIFLRVGGTLASEDAEFSIDGRSTTVLARNAFQLILSDPHPAAGMRTIESRGRSITLPFIILKLQIVPLRPGPAMLQVDVSGREQLDLPAMPVWRLGLYNPDPGRLQLLCGKPGEDIIPIHLAENHGRLTGTCRVKVLENGPGSIDGLLINTVAPSYRPLWLH
jgi:hypothetical protein